MGKTRGTETEKTRTKSESGKATSSCHEGVPLRDIAGQYSVSKTALHRHKDHIPAALAKAQEAKEVARADNLLDQVAELRDKALTILAKAEQAGDLRTACLHLRNVSLLFPFGGAADV